MRALSRRDFLNESALFATTASLLAGFDHARADVKTTEQKGPASDKLRVAVVGVNGQGMSHVRGYNEKLNCVITTVCDVDKGVIGRAMTQLEKAQGKAPKYEQDVRKVIADKDVDVISIATPNHWHALIAIWAMQNGKDVYVEKPVSHNVSEGRRIVEAARKYNKICQTGTQSRSNTGLRDSIAYIHEGKIGKVRLAKGVCYKLRPSIGKVDGPQKPPATMDYNLWCGPAPYKLPQRSTKNGTVHYDWHWIWDYGNGDLGNQGIHEMDKARWGINKNTLPRSIVSVGGRFGYVDDGQTPNTQIVFFDYGDCELIFEVRGLSSTSPYPGANKGGGRRGGGQSVGNIWYGSDGIVVCTDYRSGIAYNKDGEVVKKFSGDGNHFANFVQAVRSRKKEALHADILEGHLSSALCHLGNISYRLGKQERFDKTMKPFGIKSADEAMASMIDHLKSHKLSVDSMTYALGKKLTLDASSETFVGDKDADAMLTREYRKGFEVPTRDRV